MGKKKISVILLTLPFVFNSCIIDTVPYDLHIRNCTKDTLLIDLSKSNIHSDAFYLEMHSANNNDLESMDTTIISVKGRNVILLKSSIALPDSDVHASPYFFSTLKDTCYIYTISWQVATHYSFEEINAKKLYEKRAVTRKDFRRRIYE